MLLNLCILCGESLALNIGSPNIFFDDWAFNGDKLAVFIALFCAGLWPPACIDLIFWISLSMSCFFVFCV